MSLRTYLLLVLYASAAAAIVAAWVIASFDPTARHGEVMERVRERNAAIEKLMSE